MKVMIYKNHYEVLVFAMNLDNNPIGTKDYFEHGGRDMDDYDSEVVELPLSIMSKGFSTEGERVCCKTCGN